MISSCLSSTVVVWYREWEQVSEDSVLDLHPGPAPSYLCELWQVSQPPGALTFSSVKCSCEQYCTVDLLLELNTLVCVKL